MNVATDRASVPAGTTVERYLTVTITAPEVARRKERPALSAAVVVDRSGSMSGRKLDLAKVAAERAMTQLSSTDHLALVAYDHEVTVLAESRPATPAVKREATARLRDLDARGNTNLSGGWRMGITQAGAAPEGLRRRVMLLSDGLANSGETDPTVLAAEAQQRRTEGVTTTTFGIGEDFDEQLLASLAMQGGGHFYYIERPEQILDLLASEFGESLEVSARDARLMVAFGEGVDVEPLTAYRTARRAFGQEISFGDLSSGQELTLVLAVRVDARQIGQAARVELRLEDRDSVLFSGVLPVDWRVVSDQEDQAGPVNEAVLVTAAEAIAAGARSRALAMNRDGDFVGAREVIFAAIRRIELMGRVAGLSQVLRRLRDESDELAGEISMLRRKGLHFASHAVLASRTPEGRSRKRA